MVVSSEGKSGGLALMLREEVKVTVQNYSKYHIHLLASLDDGEVFRFTRFYGQADPNLRKESWDMLRRVKSMVKDGQIVGGETLMPSSIILRRTEGVKSREALWMSFTIS